MALERLKAYQVLEKFGEFSWGGVAAFRCPNRQAVGAAGLLYGQPFPGFGGGDSPTCRRVRIKLNADTQQRAWLIGYYKSGFGTAGRAVGKARLRGYTRTQARPLEDLKDQDEKIIQGLDPDGIHEWRLIEGTALDMQSLEMCVLETAVEGLNLPSVRMRHMCVNANVLSHFGNAPPGSLLLWDYRYGKTAGSAIFDFDYLFRVSPYRDPQGNVLSWNSGAYSQKEVEAVIRVPTFLIKDPASNTPVDWEKAAIEPERDKLKAIPGYQLGATATSWVIKAAEKESRRPYRAVDFSDLDAMLSW